MLTYIERGGPVMYALLACSFFSLTFIIERFLFWFKEIRMMGDKEIENLFNLLRSGKREDFLRQCEATQDTITHIFVQALNSKEKSLSESLSIAVDEAIERTIRSLNLIDTVITLAPLLGIFGTVMGIIQSFDLLGSSGMANPHAVSGGIAQALITTAAGLLIAMVSLIFHNYFLTRSERFAFRLEKYAKEFEIISAKQLPGVS